MASIRERTSSDGERTWAVLYRHGTKQTSKTFTERSRAHWFRDLVDLLGPDKALAELLSGDEPDRLTVDELAEAFLTWKARDVTARTLADYRRDYSNWIKPWFGHRAADSIDEADVQKFVDHMATTLAPKSVADRHMLMHSMFEFGRAKTRRLVAQNPCTETDLPKRTKRPPKGTTVGEWRALLEAAAKRNPDAHDLILFLGATGWRWSEAAALSYRDVEDDGDAMHVTVSQVFRIDGQNRQVLASDEAKSYAAFRRIRVPATAAAMIRHRSVGRATSDLVFTNRRGNHWNQNTFLRDTWPAIVRDAGLTSRAPTPHWLRHMAVAVMAAAGASLPEIQRTIGHESIQTTINVYGGMITGISGETLGKVDSILAGDVPAVVSGDVVADLQLSLPGGVQVLEPEPDPLLGQV